MTRIAPVALVLLMCIGRMASATSFAILFDKKPADGEPALVVTNPLYQDSGPKGENPLYEPKSLIFDPGQLWQGAPAEFRVTMDVDLPQTLPAAPRGAFVFGLFLTDAATGDAIHQLAQSVLITTDAGGPIAGDYTFGTFDEGTGQWAEISKADKKKENLLCGTTDHFSVFYIAPVPEPETWTMALAAIATGAGWAWRRRR